MVKKGGDRMEEREKLELLKKKFGITKIAKLALHDDADGLCSGVLMTYVFKTYEVMSPDIFGEVLDADVCVDMKPVDSQWAGLCIDHHPGHPPEQERKYKLVWGDEPTTKLVFDLFKEFIPKKHYWKMAVGTAGDGRVEIVPIEIWQQFPLLLSRVMTMGERGVKLYAYPIPLYLKVVSGLNSLCKIPGKWYSAYTILRVAEDPFDIIYDDAVKTARKLVSEERKRCIKEYPSIDLNENLRVWPIESEFKIERGLAWRAEQIDQKTTVVVNEKRGTISIRGTLAQLIYEKLREKGYEVGGHPGFGGGILKETQDTKTLLRDLKSIKI